MRPPPLRLILVVCVVLAAACGPPAVASPSEAPQATTYAEYRAAACLAWDSLDRAVGNPDTASGSDLSRALDDAVAAGDPAAADRLAASIAAELDAGRSQLGRAAGWDPARPAVEQLDRVFAAYGAMIEAKRRLAAGSGDGSAAQAAFEAAGGVDAWFTMLGAMSVVPRPADAQPCTRLGITP